MTRNECFGDEPHFDLKDGMCVLEILTPSKTGSAEENSLRILELWALWLWEFGFAMADAMTARALALRAAPTSIALPYR